MTKNNAITMVVLESAVAASMVKHYFSFTVNYSQDILEAMTSKRKLQEQSILGIFWLWRSVPKDLREFWLTPSELRDQLVAGGVTSSLDESQVSSMLYSLMKRGLKMNERLHFYRLSEFDNDSQVPLTQRENNREPPTLSDGYFKQEKLDCAADLESVEAYLSSLRTMRNQDRGQHGNQGLRSRQQQEIDADKENRDPQLTEPTNTEAGTQDGSEMTIDLDGVGYRITDIGLEQKFFKLLFEHAQKCPNGHLDCVSASKQGWGSQDIYQCSDCDEYFEFRSCSWIRTSTSSSDAKRSRLQPALSVQIPIATRNKGIGATKLISLCAETGIQCPTKRNIVQQRRKVDCAIREEGKEQLVKN